MTRPPSSSLTARRFGVATAWLLLVSASFAAGRTVVISPRTPVTATATTLGNAWHIPDDSTDLDGTHMRNPEFELSSNTAVTVYSGSQFQGSGNPGNQTGGYLYYKAAGATAWTRVALGFDSQNGNNKYWRASFSTSAFGVDDVIQYYLEVDYSDHLTTYVFGGDSTTQATATQSTAAASPFTIRNRPAYVFHSNNRTVSGNSVTFTTEAGYISKDATLQWISNGALYYTTDGTAPSGALGVAASGTTTQVVPLTYDHESNNNSIAGNSVYWTGTASLPTYTTVNYKIGLWNSSNNEEKFADYNTSGTNGATFSFSNGTVGDPVLTVNGVNGDYTTTHVFVNEISGDQIPLTVFFNPNVQNVDASTVQVYTNLNRRDYATLPYTDSFGLATQEGIEPPSGDLVGTDDGHYYKAYAMSAASGGYQTTLYANKTGAYRLTARYRLAGSSTWVYYTSNGRRDHALVVSPSQTRDIQLYELNVLNVDATGDQPAQRSTFPDLSDTSKHFNLQNYLRNIGSNWVWLQPIHPDGIDGRTFNPDDNNYYNVGSPYAVKNFFEVMPLMGKSFSGSTGFSTAAAASANDPSPVPPTDPTYAASPRGRAKADFAIFVAAADAAGVGVMLDAVFNHTSFDTEFGNNGTTLFSPLNGAAYNSEIRNYEARFFSNTNDYALRASDSSTIALAPDRTDFGKFVDVHDIYFGTYSALVDTSSDQGNYTNEGDQFFGYFGSAAYPNGDPNWNSTDFTLNGVANNITRNTWIYFASYVPYWLGQTGHVDANGNLVGNSTNANPTQRLTEDNRGIDGVRCDFGQGLPPQCWEYIINVARSYKWNFVFMTESLDGGAVTYRSNRHFDILNENIVDAFQSATTAQNYRDIFDARRSSYGQSLVLLNSTSQDEQTYSDPFQGLIRYMVSGTIDGVPMIFYGQENGISTTFGFTHYEENFGKEIPHFKEFNSLQPILNSQTYGLQQLYPDFAAVGQARQFSPALRSSNRYYLNQTGSGGIQESIFSVAKYQTANASPGVSDVVFGFVNLDRDNAQAGNYNVNVSLDGTNNLFGIHSGRLYNVRNIAAYLGTDGTRRSQFLISGNVTGDNLLANGLYVAMNPVPTTDGAWSTAPFEAQYLKLYDVTPPPTDSAPAPAKAYALGNSATFSWAAVSDSLGGIAGYRLVVSTDAAGSNVIFNSLVGNVNSYTIVNAAPGETLYARVDAVNNAGVEGTLSASSVATPVLDPNGDADGDGVTNAAEDAAGTNPLDANSVLRIVSVVRNPSAKTTTIAWTSTAGKNYQVDAAGSLTSGAFAPVSSVLAGTGGSMSFTDTSTATQTFYRVRLVP